MSGAPRATYRLQLGPHLDFAGARALVPYLRDLGVSHLYLSPCLQARAGSAHGYDVVDPTHVSDVLGGESELRALCRAGLGVILDVVPNHMAAADENPFWRDPATRARVFDVDADSGRHRRFFDIDDLAGVRVEDPEVFAQTHALVLRLVHEKLVDGLRVDHVDGLADPAGYLERLREEGVRRVWVEKILEPGERLRGWPVEGTTGYDFLGDAQGLFVDPAAEEALTRLYADLTGERRSFGEIASGAKLEQARTTFAPEVARLERELGADARGLDLGLALASLPVYRTYVRPWQGVVEEDDREALAAAGLPDRLRRILLLDEPGHEAFVTRFQQTTGAVMAKGVEDTALYRYNLLVGLNEVGGDPGRFGLPVGEFHRRAAERAARFPRSLLATTTHDTKRSADVRARILALSTMADEWRSRVLAWRELNAPLRTAEAPDAGEEYLIYQTLVGAWPISAERLERYVEKALREAKVHTSWVEPDRGWEERVGDFCRALYRRRPFLDDLETFARRVAGAAEPAALGQVLLKLTAPGVPDIYQGDELPCLALVDPDNRRPVDWERRRDALADLRAGARPDRDTLKLHLVARALGLRARRAHAFSGVYRPLEAGERACAYLRGDDVLVAATLVPGWQADGIELPPAARGRWRDVLDGHSLTLGALVPLAELVRDRPFGLLERLGDS